MDLYVNLWHNLQLVERSHYLVEVDIYMLCRCLYGFVWICVWVVSVCKLFGFVLFLSVSLKKWQQKLFCCFYKIIVRENRRGNQEFTIQRYRQHCAQKIQNENIYEHQKPTKNRGWIQMPEKGKWCPVTSLHIWKIDVKSVLGRNGMKIEFGKQVTMKILTHNLSSKYRDVQNCSW